jgi:microcystin degradation protein MlrC
VNTPGSTMSNIQEFDWVHLPRPIYPFDDLSSWRPETS